MTPFCELSPKEDFSIEDSIISLEGISKPNCEQAFESRNYGMRVIKKAYGDGYIKRFGKKK
jgi:hypothetical protein